MSEPISQKKAFSTDRVKALSDGIFGIAMTLLVLDVKEAAQQSGGFSQQLQPVITKLFPYIVSFLILGIYWTGHHSQFFFIKCTTRMHLWLNVVLLMFIALIPFSASLLTEKQLNRFSVQIYGINLIAVLFAFYLQWWYATYKHRLVHASLSSDIIKDVKKRMVLQFFGFLIAFAVSYINTTISILLFLLVQVIYLLFSVQSVTGAPPHLEQEITAEQTENG
jgi:uncharacterized membrane protein